MDIQQWVSSEIARKRTERMQNSDQLTLGGMIAKLEPIVANQKEVIEKYKGEATVKYDFEYLFPTRIDSWRGSYAELALNFVASDRGRDHSKELTVTQFLKILKDAVGSEFTGYKGGEFTMDNDTPVWVANYGNSGNTAVIDIVDNNYQVIIMTAYREF